MLTLDVKKREIFGKKVDSLLKEGFIPVEIYGNGFENIHATVLAKEFKNVFKEAGESSLVTLKIDRDSFPVLIYDIQKDVLGDVVTHIDLYRVRMDQKITTEVPLHFIGEAPAVKERGGVLIKSVESVEIEALPGDLPHSLEISLESLMELHQSIHIKNIALPKGVKILMDPEMTIATVAEPQKEEVVETPPTVSEEGAAAETTTPESGQTEEEKK